MSLLGGEHHRKYENGVKGTYRKCMGGQESS